MFNQLSVRDALLSSTTNLPAAGATTYSAPFDFGPEAVHHVVKRLDLRVDIPALAGLADAKNIVLQVQDSADNSSYTNLGISATLTGAGGNGSPGAALRLALPPQVRQFVRISLSVDSAGGALTGSAATSYLAF